MWYTVLMESKLMPRKKRITLFLYMLLIFFFLTSVFLSEFLISSAGDRFLAQFYLYL